MMVRSSLTVGLELVHHTAIVVDELAIVVDAQIAWVRIAVEVPLTWRERSRHLCGLIASISACGETHGGATHRLEYLREECISGARCELLGIQPRLLDLRHLSQLEGGDKPAYAHSPPSNGANGTARDADGSSR